MLNSYKNNEKTLKDMFNVFWGILWLPDHINDVM